MRRCRLLHILMFGAWRSPKDEVSAPILMKHRWTLQIYPQPQRLGVASALPMAQLRNLRMEPHGVGGNLDVNMGGVAVRAFVRCPQQQR